jgi:L-alanine-DL-glutamate epimerase-like enolase superfamily enzyme
MAHLELTCQLLSVPVRFRIARARIVWSHHVLVSVRHGAHTGVGEGVLYQPRPLHAARLLRTEVLPWARRAVDPLGTEPEELRAWAAVCPGLAEAVDGALWDLRGRTAGVPVAALLGTVRRRRLPVTEQVFIADQRRAGAELAAIRGRGTRRVKVKIGSGPAADLRAVQRARAALGPDVELRVDANCAYAAADALPLCEALAALGVVAFEEPLTRGDWPALRELRRRLGVAVILDESVRTPAELAAALDGEALDLLNLKLARLGGITRAREVAARCAARGVGVLVGASEELGVGTAQIAHLAAVLAGDPEVEALGALRLGFDVAEPTLAIADGALAVPSGPGLGVALRARWWAGLPSRCRVFDLAAPSARLWAFAQLALLRQRAINATLRAGRTAGRAIAPARSSSAAGTARSSSPRDGRRPR